MNLLTSMLGAVGMGHHFVVNIDSPPYDLGTWSRVSGLQVNWNSCTYRVGDQGNKSWVIPGTTKYQNIKLSRAACPDSEIVQLWLAQTSMNPTPISGAISLVMAGTGIPMAVWQLNEFFPIGWSIDDFDAGFGKPVVETLEITHGGFLLDQSLPQL